jgi:hypothetical protein
MSDHHAIDKSSGMQEPLEWCEVLGIRRWDMFTFKRRDEFLQGRFPCSTPHKKYLVRFRRDITKVVCRLLS